MQIVNQTGLEVLANRRNATADPDIAIACRGLRLTERRLDPVGHEMKRRPAFHPDRRTRVMRQYEGGHMIGRLVTPPSLPAVIRPGAANRPKHIASENPRADVLEAFFGHPIVDAGLTIALTMHATEYSRRKEPRHDLGP